MTNEMRMGRDGKRMLYVPSGWFTMGTADADVRHLSTRSGDTPGRFSDETPEHRVFLEAFYIDETPVTKAEYHGFLNANPLYAVPPGWDRVQCTYPPRQGEQPVVNVSWEDARAYAAWADKQLPTEAQWEKAARGSDRRIYPWGNEFDPTRCNIWEIALFDTTPVTRYAPRGNSPYGVIDMAGNVWEWCADWYAADYYSRSPSHNPAGPVEGLFRVLRGGAWSSHREDLRASNRHYFYPRYRDVIVGFRCVQSDGE